MDAIPRSTLKSVVGPEPCLQCIESQRAFCGSKGIKCRAFEAYEDFGITYVTSSIGWVLPSHQGSLSGAKGRKDAQMKLTLVKT